MVLVYNAIVILFLLRFLVILGFIISNTGGGVKSSRTSFECGFDTFGSARVPFSLSFFMLGIIFLVFDVEIAVVFPITMGLYYAFGVLRVYRYLIFLFVLIVGLLYEWREGSLDWVSV